MISRTLILSSSSFPHRSRSRTAKLKLLANHGKNRAEITGGLECLEIKTEKSATTLSVSVSVSCPLPWHSRKKEKEKEKSHQYETEYCRSNSENHSRLQMQNIVGQTEKNDLLVMQKIMDQNREKNPIYREKSLACKCRIL